MSLWAFPRKVATVIRNETGTVVWGFTKAGFIYGVERYAQYVVVAGRLADVEEYLNEPDQDKGIFAWLDFFGRKDSEGTRHFFDGDLALFVLLNTGIRMVGHGAMAGTIVASVYPHLPLTFIVGSTALVVAAADVGGRNNLTKKPSAIEWSSAAVGGALCVVYGPGSVYAPVSWNVGKFLVGGFLTREIVRSLSVGYMAKGVDGVLVPDMPQWGPYDNSEVQLQKDWGNRQEHTQDQSAAERIGEVAVNAGISIGTIIFAGSLLE